MGHGFNCISHKNYSVKDHVFAEENIHLYFSMKKAA